MKRTNSFAARNVRTAAEEGETVTMGKTQSWSRKKCKAQPKGESIARPEGETGEGHWSARIQRSGGKPKSKRGQRQRITALAKSPDSGDVADQHTRQSKEGAP